MAVVTVSRLYGIGGREFGRALADELGYAYFDKDLLGIIAARAETTEGAVSSYEETEAGPARHFREFCHRKYPGTRPEIMDPARYAGVLRSVIEDLARHDRAVIVGRGGQAILAGRPRTVHLRLIADREHLVRNLAGQARFAGLPAAELWRRSENYRQSRRLFVKQHFDRDVEDPLLYDLVINVGRVTPGEAVGIVAGLIRRRESAGC